MLAGARIVVVEPGRDGLRGTISLANEIVDITAAVSSAHRGLEAAWRTALQPWGLTFSRYRVLRELESCSPRMDLTSLSRKLGLHRTTVVSLLSGLSQQGLVLLETDPADRRRVLVSATDMGAVRLEDVEQMLASGPSWVASHVARSTSDSEFVR